MENWLRRHKGVIVFALTLVVTALLLANAWKYRLVSAEWLAMQKDALSALNSIVTLFVLVGGAIFSYYRFFRGRTLSLRAELDISASIHDTPHDYFFHATTLSAKNVGTSTIWNPKPHVKIQIHGPSGVSQIIEITNWWEETPAADAGPSAGVIEPDETVYFFAQRQIPKAAWAVTYMAALQADSGDSWFIAKTVSNFIPGAFADR